MPYRRVFRGVRPYLTAVAVIILLFILVGTIFLTEVDLPWTTFLTGVLSASILALATRATRAEWSVLRRSAKLSSMQEKYTQEVRLRQSAEAVLAKFGPRIKLVDELLPVMLACVDLEHRFQYHNRAFRDWVGLRADMIDGETMKDVLGTKIFGDLAPILQEVLAGRPVSQQATRTMRNGAVYHLLEQFVPYRNEHGTLAGFYMLHSDITERNDLADRDASSPAAENNAAGSAARKMGAEQDMYVDSFSEEISGSKDAADRIIAAIEKSEFRLYCQRIEPLDAQRNGARHYEVLIRLIEEEESMLSPGAFFPLAEKYGLMPRLDRWVVEHAVKWASFRSPGGRSQEPLMLFINVANATINDPDFPDYVGQLLEEYNLDAGTLCFEIIASEIANNHDRAVLFADNLRAHGCHIALAGFGRDTVSFELLSGIKIDFLKIDGAIILDVFRDPLDMARLKSVNRVAKTIGVKTVAELVEDQQTIDLLRQLGVDYAQGFGISQPSPLADVA